MCMCLQCNQLYTDLVQVGKSIWELQATGSKMDEIKAFPGLWEFMQVRNDLKAMELSMHMNAYAHLHCCQLVSDHPDGAA